MTRKSLLKIISSFILAAFLLFSNGKNILAQTDEGLGLEISPSIKVLDLNKGDSYSYTINISKNYPEPIPVVLSLTGYIPQNSNNREFTEVLSNSADWIKVDQNSIILDSNEKKSIKVNIDIPEDVEPGSYFTTILFSPLLPERYFLDQSAHIYPNIGALLVINIIGGNISANIEIEKFEYLDENIDTPRFKTVIINSDNNYSEATGEILILDLFGNIRDSVEINEFRILPGEIHSIYSKLNKSLPKGIYQSKLIIVNRDETKIKTIPLFVMDPIVTVLKRYLLLFSVSTYILIITIFLLDDSSFIYYKKLYKKLIVNN